VIEVLVNVFQAEIELRGEYPFVPRPDLRGTVIGTFYKAIQPRSKKVSPSAPAGR
jgi:hypothetical protein